MVGTGQILLVGANLVFAQGDHKDRPYGKITIPVMA